MSFDDSVDEFRIPVQWKKCIEYGLCNSRRKNGKIFF
jgi:hypothetical protein